MENRRWSLSLSLFFLFSTSVVLQDDARRRRRRHCRRRVVAVRVYDVRTAINPVEFPSDQSRAFIWKANAVCNDARVRVLLAEHTYSGGSLGFVSNLLPPCGPAIEHSLSLSLARWRVNARERLQARASQTLHSPLTCQREIVGRQASWRCFKLADAEESLREMLKRIVRGRDQNVRRISVPD